MRLRMFFLLVGMANLSGCVVADMDSSNYRYVPWIQLFQKIDANGQTNFRERKEALYSCGIDRDENLDDKHWSLNAVLPNETSEESGERKDRVIACMKSKGYTVYGFAQCGPLKKPSGLCPN